MKNLFSKINFWLAFFLIIRLYGITNPPTEISHNWRQCLTAMVARNFDDNNNILHPSVDMEGGKEIAMEFPLFSYLIFLFNKLFGYAHWHGRLINLLFTTAGLYFFSRIVKEINTERAAFYSTLLLAASIFFSFGRKIMPDTFSASLTLGGVYFLIMFLRSGNTLRNFLFLFLSILFLTMGILSKIPSLIFIVFLLPFYLDKSISTTKKIGLSFPVIVVAITSMWWYGIWNNAMLRDGAIQLYFPMNFLDGISEIINHFAGVLEKFYFSALSGYISFSIFVAGLLLIIYKKEKMLLLIFVVSLGCFFVFMLKASNFFYSHNYYVIPFAPFMAMIAGHCLAKINNTVARVGLTILAISEAILNQQHGFRDREDMIYKTKLEQVLDKFTDPTQKIIINTGPNPQQLYFANRKGWLLDEPDHINKHLLDSISSNSYSIIVLNKKVNTAFDSSEFETVFVDANYVLLKPLKLTSP